MGTKWCPQCEQILPAGNFHRSNATSDGLHGWCKSCRSEYGKRYCQGNSSVHAKSQRRCQLRRKFGITPEDYGRMLADQKGRCAICRGKETKARRGKVIDLSVDHDHETGKIRELLCHSCNVAIGHLRHNPELIDKAAAYLRRHRGKNSPG